MSYVAAFVAGGALGIHHALETDHLAAVTTLVEEDSEQLRSAIVGASWGLGHSFPIIVIGLVFVALGIQLPESITKFFELVVGLVLIYLGGKILLEVLDTVDHHRHDHGAHVHSHLRIGDFSLGLEHTHLNGDSFIVGIIHGFAGSGALVIAIVSASPAVGTAVAFLVAFSVLSILTMGTISLVWGEILETKLTKYLKLGAGAVSIGFGLLLVIEQLVGFGLV